MKSWEPKSKMKPLLIIRPAVWNMMQKLVEIAKDEISWHCLVNRIQDDEGNDIYTVYSLEMFPQENDGAASDGVDGEYEDWIAVRMEDPDYPFNDLKMHVHSHVNMACTPSGKDDNYRQDMISSMTDDGFYIFMILNKKGQYTCSIFTKKNYKEYETDDIELAIAENYEEYIREISKDADFEAEAKELIKTYVKERKWYQCSTKANSKKSSIPINSVAKSTSSGAELLDPAWGRYSHDWD